MNVSLKNLLIIENKKWSYLETIKVSQRETVMAEILRYFFDPNEEHELGYVFIKALLQTKPMFLHDKKETEIPENIKNIVKELPENKKQKNKKREIAETEVETFNNNRIDIVINTEKLVIAIEFKINHHLDNPLNDYVDFIKCQGKLPKHDSEYKENEINSYRCNKYKGKEKYFVVLTPYWKTPIDKAKNNNDFVQITLANFIKNVESLIKLKNDFWKNQENPDQYFIYKDFINTIKNRGIIINYINNIYEKAKSNRRKIEEEYKNEDENDLHLVKKEIINRIKKIYKLIKNEYSENNIQLKEKEGLEGVVIINTGKNSIKIRLTLSGWSIEYWDESKKDNTGNYKKIDNQDIKNNNLTIMAFREEDVFIDVKKIIKNKKWLIKNTLSDIQK